jgi:uncharacterized repeat protein (TIGR02543 family)
MNANKSITANFSVIPPPAQPTNVLVSNDNCENSIFWTDNSSSEDLFRIQRSVNGGSYTDLATVAANITSVVDASIIDGNTYQYRVRAENVIGNSNYAVSTTSTGICVIAPDVEILGSWVSGTTHAAEAGVSRALVLTIHAEDDNTNMNASASYGGQAMTKVIESNEGTGYRAYAAIFILDEAGINAATNSNFSVSWAQNPSRAASYSSVFLGGVDQADLIGATSTGGASSTSTISTSAMNTATGDLVILAGTCGNTGTYSVNNGFTEAIELSVESGDGVAGYKLATGANETASITHTNANRQTISAAVINAGGSVAPTQYTLITNVVGNGSISLNPAGGEYDENTAVTLTAVPQAGYQFDGWSGDLSGSTNPANITMNSNKSVTATFSQIPVVTYNLSVNTSGSGSVVPNGGTYNENEVVTLTATPDAGWAFDSWSGDASGTANPLNVTMNSDKNVTANFIELGSGTVVTSRIASSMDDVEEAPDGSIYTGSTDLELTYDSYNGGNQTIGMRFQGLNIPQGATINSASIQFTCDEASSGTCNLTIVGHDTDNSEGFSTTANNVSSRAKTNASVSWSPAAWNTVGSAGANEQTPNIASIIQEIVNRGGYTSGSAISIIITGTGTRTAESFDGSSSQAALLTVDYSAPVITGPIAEKGVVNNVGTTWQTINLTENFTNPVIIATPVLPGSSDLPVLTRIRNVNATSFQLKVQNPSDASVSGIEVHYLAVEAGTYTVADDGVKMEAKTVTSTITAENNNWVMEARSYNQSYTSPVVLGQIMTANDAMWSTFWASSSSRSTIPTASSFYAGKNVGEDSDITRANETIGLVIFEAGTGTMGGIDFEAAVGSDIVRGPGNSSTGYNYSHALSNADVAVLSAAAIDGGNGGWPILFGGSAVTSSNITMIYDEDQVNDSERNHTTEQVAYVVMQDASALKRSSSANPIAQEVEAMENDNELSARIYPNPLSEGILTIKTEGINSSATIRIISMDGKLVFNSTMNEAELNIDLSELSKGLYVIQLTENNNSCTQKLIIK